MFSEFGQAPLCLELDLDSYEGSWTHVAAFRGRSGWLMAARATIQSERDLMRSVLLAACDEYENPIPAWRAENLMACEWSNLGECRELPPDLLDDLLCEEEGAFFARWQRQTNAELVALHERTQHDLATLDARARAIQRQADREIADLQRRRRMPEASPEARAALSQLIAQIEAESDTAVADATSRRAALRREIDAAEEALWDRGDVLIEVEPMWCVAWEAVHNRRSPRHSIRQGGWRDTKGGDLAPGEHAGGQLQRAKRLAACAVAEAPRQRRDAFPEVIAVAPSPRPVEPAHPRLDALRNQLRELDEEASRERGRKSSRLAIQRAMLAEEVRLLTQPTGVPLPVCEAVPSPEPATPPVVSVPEAVEMVEVVEIVDVAPPPQPELPPSPPVERAAPIPSEPIVPSPAESLVAARRERHALQLSLEDTIAAGERFRLGSPKFRRHQESVAKLQKRIDALDASLGGTPSAPTRETLALDRAWFVAELAAHEKRGPIMEDGAQRMLFYVARRQELTSRIARIDRRLEPTPQPAKVPAPPPISRPSSVGEALAHDRARVAADLELLERTGVTDQSNPRAHFHFNARRAEIAARLARLDAQLAHARARARNPA